MGNTFSGCRGYACMPSCSCLWAESDDTVYPFSSLEGNDESEDRSAIRKVVGVKDKLLQARGHDKEDIVLEDILPAITPNNVLHCELEDKKQDLVHSKLDSIQSKDVYSLHQTSEIGQPTDMDASIPRQTSVTNEHGPNQADNTNLGDAPGLIGHTALSDNEQTRDNLKEKQSLLSNDYSHLSEVQELLMQKIAASLQAEMEQVFPQQSVTSLLPELQATIQSEIKLPFLKQIEYCALLDRQEAELKALDRQLQREKLDHDIMFVLSQDCSKPPGIKQGQAERFGEKRRRRQKGMAQISEADQCGRRHCKRTKAGASRKHQVMSS